MGGHPCRFLWLVLTMMLKRKRRSQKGFTLVEVLIVVLIVGALAIIAIPRITSSSDAAKRNVCKSNIDLINSQIELYYVTTGEWPKKLTDVTENPDCFPDGPPTCPFGKKYNMNSDNRIKTNNHNH